MNQVISPELPEISIIMQVEEVFSKAMGAQQNRARPLRLRVLMFITSHTPAHHKGSAAVRQQDMLAFSLSPSSLKPDRADRPDVPATAT